METEKMIGRQEAGARVPSRPDLAVPAKALRRRSGAEYKARILREAEHATASGQLGALLRCVGLSSSHLAAWRKQRDAASLEALAPKRRGRQGRPALAAGRGEQAAHTRSHPSLPQAQAKEAILDVQKNSPTAWT